MTILGSSIHNKEPIAFYTEFHIPPCIRHSVCLRRIVVVMRTRVEFEHFHKRQQLFFCEQPPDMRRHGDTEPADGMAVNKATTGFGMTVRKADVGFDVENRRTVHQVGTSDIEQRTALCSIVHAGKAHRRQSHGIRTEGRTAGKDSHLLVSAQQRWSHQRTRGSMWIGRKLPYYPQIIEVFYPPQHVFVSELRRKFYRALQLVNKSTLFRYPELGSKR